MIDSDGFRPNVGIILSNPDGKVFWARRYGQNAWQFPQGGIQNEESPADAMYRELYEETGLLPEHVELMGKTSDWLRYRLPKRMVRKNTSPVCIGQKQIWFMLRMLGSDADFNLSTMDKPEFDHWCWVDYWHPMDEVVFFKRKVYQKALSELEYFVTLPVKRTEKMG
ncbi:MAG: RNA pyrophosphohydrolase [Gammaproteobacteria bacterium]|nr:RNA pyrophosphohydrolase [Gammaproteobacteria bacterium]